MVKQNKLAVLFNVEPGEGRLVLLLLAYSFFLGFTRLLVNTSAGTLLRDRFGENAAQYLPYIYIGAAIVAPLTGYVYSQFEEKFSFSRLLAGIFVLLLGTVTVFYGLLLALPNLGWPAIAFYIWYYALYALIMLAFWGLASRLLDIRQSKRLFSLIGTGMVVAMIISGFMVRPLVNLMGTVNLLLLAAGGLFSCLLLLLYITNVFNTDVPIESAGKQQAVQSSRDYKDLLRERYVVLIVLLTTFNLVAYFFLDNAFYDQAYLRFPEPDELASFLGEFLAVSSMLNLGSRTLASGKLITRYGVVVGLLTLPVALTFSAVLVSIVGTVLGATPLLFWLVVFTRLLFKVVGDAVDKPAFSILYQALPTARRLRVQTLVISIVEPLAGGVAGVILLLLSLETVQIFYGLFFIFAGWIGAALLVSREYRLVLLAGLTGNKLGELSLDTLDKSSLAILETQVANPQPAAAIYALHVLESIKHESLPRFLRRALSHPAPQVRIDALYRIERQALVSMAREVKLRVDFETTEAVRGAALQTLAYIGNDDHFDEIVAYLDSNNIILRRGAMVGLLRSGGIEGVIIAGERLIKQIESQQPEDRIFAAEVLGGVRQSNFYRPLLTLLQDDDPRVLQATLTAAGQLKNPKLWPLVIPHLQSPYVRGVATTALIAGGDTVLPFLRRILDNTGEPPDLVLRAARICGQIGSEPAKNILQAHLAYPDNDIRAQILRSLSRANYHPDPDIQPSILKQLNAEVGNAVWLLALLVDLDSFQSRAPILQALRDEVTQSRERTLLLLSFLHDSQAVLSAGQNLKSPARQKRAQALEVIENLLDSRRLKDILLPLFDPDLAPLSQLERLQTFFPDVAHASSQYQQLQQVLYCSKEWLSSWGRACALAAMAEHLTGTAQAVEKDELILQESIAYALNHQEPLLREAGLWALHQWRASVYRAQVELYVNDENKTVAAVAQQIVDADRQEITMQTTIEKVIILKSIGIFAEVPEEILATVAANLTEMTVPAGKTIIQKGQVSRTMYIVLEGCVKAHDEGQTLRYIKQNDIFGELAALDEEPHNVYVTAEVDTRLFLLSREVLHELMADHVEVAWGIIQVLTRRLRTATIDKVAPAAPVEASPSKDALLDGILGRLAD